ncbi:MAG: hypothetical protein U1G08_18870 [Verrucomicrobiota bacterium]
MSTLYPLIDDRSDWRKVQSDFPFSVEFTAFSVPPNEEDSGFRFRPEALGTAAKAAAAIQSLPPTKAEELKAATIYLNQLHADLAAVNCTVRGWRSHSIGLHRSARIASGSHDEGPLRRRLGDILNLERLADAAESRFAEPLKSEIENLERAIGDFITENK